MRRARVKFDDKVVLRVHRIVDLSQLAEEWTDSCRFLVRVRSEDERIAVNRLARQGLTNVGCVEGCGLESGDVVVPAPRRDEAVVLYRESDTHHSLLLTNQCNSNCLMCSQPPTRHDDRWLVDEALDVLRHMRIGPQVLGFSGGEPLLIGALLREVLDVTASLHPSTKVEVLTNGRLLAERSVADALLPGLGNDVTWLVPLYGHADFVHDFVVQARGAFEETIAGLLNLRQAEQPIQLRIVLIDPVLRVLPELCTFIGRNLPFVREVALMACEPIGFALANRDQCEVDLADWTLTLEQSTRVLRRHGVPHLFMNTPLCALPKSLWRDAHKSISDWKNVYLDECSTCAVRQRCSGLFAWHERGWKPTRVAPVEEVDA